jgi:hypothetical protein
MNSHQIQLLLESEYYNDNIDLELEPNLELDSLPIETPFEKNTVSKGKTLKAKKTASTHKYQPVVDPVVNQSMCSIDMLDISPGKLDKTIRHCLTIRKLKLVHLTPQDITVSCSNNKIFCFSIHDFLNGSTCDCISCNQEKKKRIESLAKKSAKNNVIFLTNEYIEGIVNFPIKCTNNVTHILNQDQFYANEHEFECGCNSSKNKPNSLIPCLTHNQKVFYIEPRSHHQYETCEFKSELEIFHSVTNPYPENLQYTFVFLKRLLIRTSLPTFQILDNIDYRTLKIIYDTLSHSINNEVGISVDHIIPFSFFDVNNISHVRACWDIRNLRFMTSTENSQKSNGIRYIDLDYINSSKFLSDVFYNLLNIQT